MILIGKRIKELRNKYKYTQTELADKVGVTKSTVAAYENDSRLPSYDVLIKMANVFKTSVDSLLLSRSEEQIIDVSGLNPHQISILETLINYFRKSELIDAMYSDQPLDVERLIRKYPDVFNMTNMENLSNLLIENNKK